MSPISISKDQPPGSTKNSSFFPYPPPDTTMDFTRSPFKPVNRSVNPQNIPDATMDHLLTQLKRQNQLKNLGTPSTRFCKAVDSIVANKKLPPEFQDDWVSFIRLALVEVLSAKKVKDQCRASFQAFLSVADTLPKEACQSMSKALMFYKNPDPALQNLVNQLMLSLELGTLKEQEGVQLEKVKYLERITAVPRERGDAKHSGDQFTDMPELQEFMQSDEVETRIYGFYGIADARKKLNKLIPKLPAGSMYEALGKGKKAHIVIEKPCWCKRRDWKAWCENKAELEKALSELANVRADMRKFERSFTVTTSKKRRVE